MKRILSFLVAFTLLASLFCVAPVSVLAATVVTTELPDIDTSITFEEVYDTVSDENGGYVNSWSYGKSERYTFPGTMLMLTSMTKTTDKVANYDLVKESSGNVYLKMTGYNHQLRAYPDDPSTSDYEYYGGRQTLNFRIKLSSLAANLLIQPYFLADDGTESPMNLNFMNTKKINFNAAYGVSDSQNNQGYVYDVWYNVVMIMDFDRGLMVFNAYNETANTKITAASDISGYQGISEVRFQNQASAEGGTILIDNISFMKDEFPDVDTDVTFDDVYDTISDGSGGYVNSWLLPKSSRQEFPGSMLLFTSESKADNVASYELIKEADGNVYLKMSGYNHQLRAMVDKDLTRDMDYYGQKVTLSYRIKLSGLNANFLIQPYLLKTDGTRQAMNLTVMSAKKINFNAVYGVADAQNNQAYSFDTWYNVAMEFDFVSSTFNFTAVNESTKAEITASSDISGYLAIGDEIRFQNQASAEGGVICIDDLKLTQESVKRGKFIYTVDSDGNAVISGYTDLLTAEEQTNLVIPDMLDGKYPVIGAGGFKGNTTIQTLTLPSTLQYVSDEGFASCTSLTDVTMPSVETLGYRAFYGCSKLVRMNSDYTGEAVLPEGLSVLGNQSFRTSNSIKTLIIPKSVTSFGGAFGNTSGLRNVYFPDNIDQSTYNTNFAGGFASFQTIYAYGSSASYIKTYAETAVDSSSGNKIYSFIEENSDLIAMDAEFTDGIGVALRGTEKDASNGSNAVGFNARLFNTGSEDIDATAIISVTGSDNKLKSVGIYALSIPSWQGMSLSYSELKAENVTLETGDKIKVMFWESLGGLMPITTRDIEYTADLTEEEILVMAIGNSFSQDSITFLDEIAAADGVNLSAYTCYVGGRPLIHHYDGILNADDEANPNRLYTMRSGSEDYVTLTAPEMLQMYDWDYVTLQAATHTNCNDRVFWNDTYDYTEDGYGAGNSADAVKAIADVVEAYAPNAKRAFVAPWAVYEDIADDYTGGVFADGTPDSRGAMTAEILTRQEALASSYASDGMVLPTAVAVDYLIRHYGFPEFELLSATNTDTFNNSSTTLGVYRDSTCHLTNSVGRVLAGLVWYEMITGNSAEDNAYTNSLSAEDMAKIKAAAHYACQNYQTYNPLTVEPAEGTGETLEITLDEAQSLVPSYPDGKLKAFTARYDDGNTGDNTLVDIFNDNGIKGTFYLVSKFLAGTNENHIKASEVQSLYLDAGHEIANHSYNHYVPGNITEAEFIADIQAGYDYLNQLNPGKIKGFAYPSSQYGQDKAATLAALESIGHTYAVCGTSTNSFDLPDLSKPYELPFTMRHSDENYDFVEVASEFAALNPESQKLFFLMGHSFELEDDYETTSVKKSFDDMRTFAETIGGKEDIWYATNGEVFEYLIAQKKLGSFTESGYYKNTSDYTLCYINGDSLITLNPGDTLKVN